MNAPETPVTDEHGVDPYNSADSPGTADMVEWFVPETIEVVVLSDDGSI